MSDYSRTKVKTEKIEGHVVTFSVSDDGIWYATAAVVEDEVHGSTIIECRQKVTGRLRRATLHLEIKATLVNTLTSDQIDKSWYGRDEEIKANLSRPITLTGISQRGGYVMYQFDDEGTKPQNRKKNPHQSRSEPDMVGVVCRRLVRDEEKQYRELRDAYDAACLALSTWIEEHKIPNIAEYLEEQVSQAVDREPDEVETPPRKKKRT